MNDNRNMLLAIVLSAIVLIGWSLLSDQFFPAAPQTEQAAKPEAGPAPAPGPAPLPDTAQPVRPTPLVLAETPRVRIETPRLEGSINLKGARIDDLVLVQQRDLSARGLADLLLEFTREKLLDMARRARSLARPDATAQVAAACIAAAG